MHEQVSILFKKWRGAPECTFCVEFFIFVLVRSQVAFSKAEAGMFSVVFDVGGIVGSAGVGVFINRSDVWRKIVTCKSEQRADGP